MDPITLIGTALALGAAAAVGLTALLAGTLETSGRTVGVLITGGNVTSETHYGLLQRGRLSEQH